jgi:hypothetical protein
MLEVLGFQRTDDAKVIDAFRRTGTFTDFDAALAALLNLNCGPRSVRPFVLFARISSELGLVIERFQMRHPLM